MNRRHLIGGSLAAGLTGLAAAPETAAAGGQEDGAIVAAALRELSGTLSTFLGVSVPGPLGEIALVRQQQRTFIRANHKYPNYIEVGLNVWESAYFWHVQHRQPLELGRLADGRYTLRFIFSTLILRPDVDLDYVSLGFDDEPLPPR